MKPTLALLVACLGIPCPARAQTTVGIDVFAAYLHVDPADSTAAAPALALAGLGLNPGDTVHLQPVGDWDAGPWGDEQINTLVVFSADATLLAPTAPHRVPGALAAGVPNVTGPTWPSGEPTDIPEDFAILVAGGVSVVIPAGATHVFVTVADIYYRDNSDPDGDFGVQITLEAPTSAALGPSSARDALTAQPNPFEHETAIRFEIVRAARVRLTIHDVAGRVVRTVLDGMEPAGTHVAAWNGRTDSGRRAAPGVYFARLEDGVRRQTLRVSLVR
jgi:hypothetical protein